MIDVPSFLAQLILAFLTAAVPEPAGGEDPNLIAEARAAHAAAAEAAAGGGDRYFTAPFLLADREAREVTVWGQMTGMFSGDAVEFFAITDQSGHDYEALLTTWVRAGDLHRAMEFIGLSAGGPVDAHQHRFWPRGPAVDAELELILPGEEKPRRIPAHEWIARPDGSVMEYMPWLFVGSRRLPDPNREGVEVYAADHFSPNSIASTFNLSGTVFDLPVQGSKSGAYGQFLRNPALVTRHGQPVLLRLRPTPPGRLPRERDLLIPLGNDSPPEILSALRGELEADSGTVVWARPDFSADLSLSALRRLAAGLMELEEAFPRFRIEPPPPGQLYVQAYAPPERFRQRSGRPSQPWELHLHRSGEALRATLVDLREVWDENHRPRIVEEQRIPLESPAEWRAHLDAHEPLIRVLFVFAPDDLTHGELMAWLTEAGSLFPTLYVYRH